MLPQKWAKLSRTSIVQTALSLLCQIAMVEIIVLKEPLIIRFLATKVLQAMKLKVETKPLPVIKL
jgi:hypothetical protein